MSFLEIQKSTISQYQKPFLPLVKHTITLFPYHARFQKLDHRIFNNRHSILLTNRHDLVLQSDIRLFRRNQFINIVCIEIKILVLLKLSEDIFGTYIIHSNIPCRSLFCERCLFLKSFLIMLDLVFLGVLIYSFLAISLLTVLLLELFYLLRQL